MKTEAGMEIKEVKKQKWDTSVCAYLVAFVYVQFVIAQYNNVTGMLQGRLSVMKDKRKKQPCPLQKAANQALQFSFALACFLQRLDQMESAIKTKFDCARHSEQTRRVEGKKLGWGFKVISSTESLVTWLFQCGKLNLWDL